MTLITEYSGWFFIFCLLLGAIYAFALYFKNKNIEFSQKMQLFLAILRGTVISFIAFLLLAPMLKLTMKHKEKPLIVFAIDNSASLVCGKDSAFYQNDFSEEINQLIQSFGSDYEIKPFLIGEKIVPINPQDQVVLNFEDKNTNLSSIFDNIDDYYANQNVGAVILLSDGIFNTGSNPFYKTAQLKCPIYTVGLGNTQLQTDFLISSVNHNRQVYKGNYFPVEVNILATKLAGKSARLTVVDDENNEFFKKDISISGMNYFETVKFSIQAGEKGVYRYQVHLTELDGEITYKNNHFSFFVKVVESKEKIAIIYHAPHPDVSAMKQALEMTDNYEVETFAAEEFKADPETYTLIVLHQLPSVRYSMATLLSKIQQKGISSLFVLGNQTNLPAFSGLNTGLSISQNKQLYNDAFPSLNSNFTLFTFPEEARQIVPFYPPLHTFFGDYKLSGSANVFMYQRINNVDTDYPLIVFNQTAGAKIGVIAGDGLWQWRMYNFIQTENHDAFNELMNKIALYLSVKADKSFFRIYSKPWFDENEALEFSAELYDESYELISDPEVKMVMTDEKGNQYSSLFSKKNNAYYLKMTDFPPGTYKWVASTAYGNKQYSKSGSFMVRPVEAETQNLVADHALLKSMAQNSDGLFYEVADMQNLIKDIGNNDNIKTIASYSKNYNLLLNSWLYFVVLILLMGVEWFLRKWAGGY